MGQPEPPSCIIPQWKTQRPYYGGMRRSSNFHFRQHEMCLELEFLKLDLNSIRIGLQWRRKPPALDTTLFAYCYLTVGDLIFSQDIKFESSNLKSYTPARTLFLKSLNLDEVKSVIRVEEWIVACYLSFGLSHFNKVKKETIHLSTVDDTIQPSRSIDHSSSTVPRNIEALSRDYSRLLEEEIFSDLQLSCEGRIFKVHRCVLAARSEVFRAMLLHEMLESKTGNVLIQDLPASVLHLMLKFLYSGKLEDVTAETASDLYEAADKYAVRSLVTACTCLMLGDVTEQNCIGYLEKSDSHSDPDLKSAAVSYLLRHPSVFKSAAWGAFCVQRPALAVEVLQTYVTSINQ